MRNTTLGCAPAPADVHGLFSCPRSRFVPWPAPAGHTHRLHKKLSIQPSFFLHVLRVVGKVIIETETKESQNDRSRNHRLHLHQLFNSGNVLMEFLICLAIGGVIAIAITCFCWALAEHF